MQTLKYYSICFAHAKLYNQAIGYFFNLIMLILYISGPKLVNLYY